MRGNRRYQTLVLLCTFVTLDHHLHCKPFFPDFHINLQICKPDFFIKKKFARGDKDRVPQIS